MTKRHTLITYDLRCLKFQNVDNMISSHIDKSYLSRRSRFSSMLCLKFQNIISTYVGLWQRRLKNLLYFHLCNYTQCLKFQNVDKIISTHFIDQLHRQLKNITFIYGTVYIVWKSTTWITLFNTKTTEDPPFMGHIKEHLCLYERKGYQTVSWCFYCCLHLWYYVWINMLKIKTNKQ